MATSYHLKLRKDKARANGEAPVYLRITHARQSRYLSTGVFILPKYWNPEKEHVRKSHPNHKSLNAILQNELNKAIQVQEDLSNQNRESAKAIQKRLKNQQTGNFFDLADDYMEELKAQQRHHAVKTLRVVLRKLEAHGGGRELLLKNLDANYLERFETFLKREYGNANTTINKNFEPIREILEKAFKNHLISANPFSEFDGAKRGKPSPKTKLSIDQIRDIEALELPRNSSLWHARNVFLFSFYSGGIRFGDMCCLKWDNIKGDRLSYQMLKNDKVFTIQMNEHQQSILEAYKHDNPDDFIFPLLNNYKDYSSPTVLRQAISTQNVIINKNLKAIAKKAGIRENISFHVARHSFAQYAVESGLGAYELMQLLRHSKLETTQNYLKELDEQLADKAMKKVF